MFVEEISYTNILERDWGMGLEAKLTQQIIHINLGRLKEVQELQP